MKMNVVFGSKVSCFVQSGPTSETPLKKGIGATTSGLREWTGGLNVSPGSVASVLDLARTVQLPQVMIQIPVQICVKCCDVPALYGSYSCPMGDERVFVIHSNIPHDRNTGETETYNYVEFQNVRS